MNVINVVLNILKNSVLGMPNNFIVENVILYNSFHQKGINPRRFLRNVQFSPKLNLNEKDVPPSKT